MMSKGSGEGDHIDNIQFRTMPIDMPEPACIMRSYVNVVIDCSRKLYSSGNVYSCCAQTIYILDVVTLFRFNL